MSAPTARTAWSQAIAAPAAGGAPEALLRLEIAAEVTTPADQLAARRALQLQLLTRRNDPRRRKPGRRMWRACWKAPATRQARAACRA